MATNFEIASLKRAPPQYSHVSGLLHVFKSKLQVPGLNSDLFHISARFAYVLNDWSHERRWPASAVNCEATARNFRHLPHGCIDEPVSELQLAALWPSTSGDAIMDNEVNKGFDPLSAPEWSLRLRYADDVLCMLSFSLQELMKVLSCQDSVSDLMNFHSPPPDHHQQSKDIGHALDRIADPPKAGLLPMVSPKLADGISKVVSNSQNFIKRGAVSIGRMAVTRGERIPRELMEEIKAFLFAPKDSESESEGDAPAAGLKYTQIKAAPKNSFTYRLAICVAVLNLCHGGVWAVTQLLHVVVNQLREHLDNGERIPGVGDSGPDHRSCLLHQKLQMLNCCISRKKAREQLKEEEQESSPSTSAVHIEVAAVGEETSCVAASSQEEREEASDDGKASDCAIVSASSGTSGEPMTEKSNDKMTESEKNAVEYEENSSSVKDDDESSSVVAGVVKEAMISSSGSVNVDSLPLTDRSILSDDSSDEFFECDDGEFDDEPAAAAAAAAATAVETPSDGDELEEMEVENVLGKSAVGADEKETDDQNIEDSEESCDQKEIVEEMVVDSEAAAAADDRPPEGRLEPMKGGLKLLHRNAPLFIPVTQDHALLTEDQLIEQAEIFSALGDTKEGSKVRAKMQSVSLEADMAAFKAANPGCVLEDFVRWYSPRDFENGSLSARMRLADNLWANTWNSTQAIPSHRQKRLFDDTKEAEKVLHFFANLKPSRATELVFPVCVYDALLRLGRYRDSMRDILESLPSLCGQLEEKASRMFHQYGSSGTEANTFDPADMSDLIRQIAFAESLIERSRSLVYKFSALDDAGTETRRFVRQLLEHPEVRIAGAAGGRIGKIVRTFFRAQQEKKRRQATTGETVAATETQLPEEAPEPTVDELPEPTGREFILRAMIRHPSDFSQKLPQRLYAVMMRNEFRLASAISSDSTFF